MLTLLILLLTPTAPLDVQADRLELDQKTGQVRFEGAVRATQGALTLRCARLSARYRKDGSLGDLRASGGVVVTQGDLSARAAEARYSAKDKRLELIGDPVVRRGPDELRGEKILYWPEQERLVVERARGRLQAPKLTLPAPPAAPR